MRARGNEARTRYGPSARRTRIHRTSLADVIGGIGYILGIFGLWAYFQSKRKQDS